MLKGLEAKSKFSSTYQLSLLYLFLHFLPFLRNTFTVIWIQLLFQFVVM